MGWLRRLLQREPRERIVALEITGASTFVVREHGKVRDLVDVSRHEMVAFAVRGALPRGLPLHRQTTALTHLPAILGELELRLTALDDARSAAAAGRAMQLRPVA